MKPCLTCGAHVWGSPENPQTITTANTSTLSVTEHLALTLRHVRREDEQRVLWIDAICINQRDDVEKGVQVAMMEKIYRWASRVVVFLGAEQDGSGEAMDYMAYLGSQVEVDFGTFAMTPSEQCADPSISDKSLPLSDMSPELLKRIYQLLSRPWYGRLWIRPEIFLANSGAVVLCGFHQVSWATYRKALVCLRMKSKIGALNSDSPYLDSVADRLFAIQGLIFQSGLDFLGDLRWFFQGAACFDPRDRVYAALEMLDGSERSMCSPPDYTKSSETIYQGIMLQWMDHFQSLDLLRDCLLLSQPLRMTLSSPTWVPNWSQTAFRCLQNGGLRASSQLLGWYDTSGAEEGVLRTSGVATTKIIGSQRVFAHTTREAKEKFEDLRRIFRGNGDATERPTATDYARALVVNQVAEIDDSTQGWPELRYIREVVELALSPNYIYRDDDFQGPLRKTLEDASHFCGMNYLFHCTEGCVGLSPLRLQPDDEVCVILGCDSPIVLRPVSENEYLVVGECFLAGLSHGEAFLGPFPPGTRPTMAYNESRRMNMRCFKDDMSGEVFKEDPRLSAWSLNLTEFGHRLKQNPGARLRIHPDVLQQQGCKIKYFNLI